jgi:aryl-alcohol dehydrogenase-like predicted oxidoreductase
MQNTKRKSKTNSCTKSHNADLYVVERVAELAEKHRVPRIHIALAWLLQKEAVSAPIIGATKISHLEGAVESLSVKLTPEEIAFLKEPYVPHPIVGHN